MKKTNNGSFNNLFIFTFLQEVQNWPLHSQTYSSTLREKESRKRSKIWGVFFVSLVNCWIRLHSSSLASNGALRLPRDTLSWKRLIERVDSKQTWSPIPRSQEVEEDLATVLYMQVTGNLLRVCMQLDLGDKWWMQYFDKGTTSAWKMTT
jgi:hypothetical protein